MKNKVVYLLKFNSIFNFLSLKNGLNKYIIFSFLNDFIFDLKVLKSNSNIFFFKNKLSDNFYLIFYSKSKILYFKNYFLKLLNDLYMGFWGELKVIGRNYKFFFENNYLIIFLGFCHYIYIYVPKSILIVNIYERNTRLKIFSFKKLNLLYFARFLKSLYNEDIYKGKGIFFNFNRFKKDFKLKQGKKKNN